MIGKINIDKINLYCIKCERNLFRTSIKEDSRGIDMVFMCLKCRKEILVEIEK
jgi:DNA-directed RNA polymerase subunit RPC12/RpoP